MVIELRQVKCCFASARESGATHVPGKDRDHLHNNTALGCDSTARKRGGICCKRVKRRGRLCGKDKDFLSTQSLRTVLARLGEFGNCNNNLRWGRMVVARYALVRCVAKVMWPDRCSLCVQAKLQSLEGSATNVLTNVSKKALGIVNVVWRHWLHLSVGVLLHAIASYPVAS